MSAPKSLLLCAAVLFGTAATATAKPVAPSGFKLKTFATAPGATTSGPDDIAALGKHIFVGWQNGIGPKGEPAPKTHQTHSVVVEYNQRGHALHQWRLTGKVDGLGGDPANNVMIATANEDGNSAVHDRPQGRARAPGCRLPLLAVSRRQPQRPVVHRRWH